MRECSRIYPEAGEPGRSLSEQMPSSLGALPHGEERGGQTFGLDPVRRVEVVAFAKRLDREVREDRGQPVGYAGE